MTIKWLGGSTENSADVFDDNGLPLDEDEKTEPNVADGGKGGSDGSGNSSSM